MYITMYESESGRHEAAHFHLKVVRMILVDITGRSKLYKPFPKLQKKKKERNKENTFYRKGEDIRGDIKKF